MTSPLSVFVSTLLTLESTLTSFVDTVRAKAVE